MFTCYPLCAFRQIFSPYLLTHIGILNRGKLPKTPPSSPFFSSPAFLLVLNLTPPHNPTSFSRTSVYDHLLCFLTVNSPKLQLAILNIWHDSSLSYCRGHFLNPPTLLPYRSDVYLYYQYYSCLNTVLVLYLLCIYSQFNKMFMEK